MHLKRAQFEVEHQGKEYSVEWTDDRVEIWHGNGVIFELRYPLPQYQPRPAHAFQLVRRAIEQGKD